MLRLILAAWLTLNLGAVAEPEISTHQAVEMAVQRWFEPELWPTMMCIIDAESDFDPFAVGRAGELGLGQVHPVHFWAYDEERLRSGDIEYQVAVMHNQWEGSGLRPWAAQKGRCF